MEDAGAGGGDGELADKVLTIFQRFDTNGDGCIDRDELKHVMITLDPTMWNDRRLSRLLHALDKNRDGRLQYREFVEWACGEDAGPELAAFRQSLALGREEAQRAPRELPAKGRRPSGPRGNPNGRSPGPNGRASRSVSRTRTKNAQELGQEGEASNNSRMQPAPKANPQQRSRAGSRSRPSVRRKTTPPREEAAGAEERGAPAPPDAGGGLASTVSLPIDMAEPEALPLARALTQGAPPDSAEAAAEEACTARDRAGRSLWHSGYASGAEACSGVGSDRLIIFDYDGTITIDKDERSKGLTGHRLNRLKEMMERIRASTARCILVTAQFPIATRDITIPSLEKTGLSGLFEDESLDARLRLYWDDEAHGTVYNGAKVMLGKIDLIRKILDGLNCWGLSFAPSNVLFIDDDPRNFNGNDKLGIQIRQVEQDGMVEADMILVEAFAEGR